MTHKLYALSCENSARILAEGKIIKKTKGLSFFLDALGFLYRADKTIYSTMEPNIHMDEYLWLTSLDKEVFFFESIELAERIAGAAVRIPNPDALYSGFETFMLAIPSGMARFEDITGVLVTVMKHDKENMRRCLQLFQDMGLPLPALEDHGHLGRFAVSLTYRHARSAMWYRLTLPNYWIGHVLNADGPDEFINLMAKHSRYNFAFMEGLTAEEKAQQYELCKLVCGFIIYKRSLPHRIQSGLPGKFTFGTFATGKGSVQAIMAPSGHRASPNAHYRSWHFRQLNDERFYQGEHATKPRGSRIVFVSDSLVNSQSVNPETAIGGVNEH